MLFFLSAGNKQPRDGDFTQTISVVDSKAFPRLNIQTIVNFHNQNHDHDHDWPGRGKCRTRWRTCPGGVAIETIIVAGALSYHVDLMIGHRCPPNCQFRGIYHAVGSSPNGAGTEHRSGDLQPDIVPSQSPLSPPPPAPLSLLNRKSI